MRKKEIKGNFEKLSEQIKNLEKGQEDLYEITQFILGAISKYIDEPIYRIKANSAWHRSVCGIEYILQYAYKNKLHEIETYEDIHLAELFAYCDTHFILKNQDNKCFLIDMGQRTITNIPIQLLLSREMNLTIEGQVLKVCHTGPGAMRCKND